MLQVEAESEAVCSNCKFAADPALTWNMELIISRSVQLSTALIVSRRLLSATESVDRMNSNR